MHHEKAGLFLNIRRFNKIDVKHHSNEMKVTHTHTITSNDVKSISKIQHDYNKDTQQILNIRKLSHL